MRLSKWVACAAVMAVALAACGDDDDSATTTTDNQVESGDFVIGFTNPSAQNEQLRVLQEGIEARADAIGAEVISLDSQLDVDKQVTDFDQLIAEDVDVIITLPLDSAALEPSVERAQEAGIKVVGLSVSLDEPDDIAPYDAAVNQGLEQQATEAAELVAEELGGTGNVVGIGIGFPVPVILFQVAAMEEQAIANGLTWLDTLENPSDDAAGAQPLIEEALLRFDDIDAIIAYNDPSALGATAALRGAGKEGVIVTGSNGSEEGIDLVRDGTIAATWDLLPWKQGLIAVNVAIALAKGEDVAPSTTVAVQMLTSDNLDDQIPWDDALEQIRSGEISE